MRSLILIAALLPCLSLGQSSGKVWTEAGVKGSVIKDLDWAVELTNRFGGNGLETFFPQVSLKYKVTKWLRPSIDYRGIFDKDVHGNYLFSNRLNFNVEAKHAFDRLELSGRIRYQYSFNTLSAGSSYDSEFDQAIRFKAQVKYDINNSFFSPVLNTEFFYDPAYGPLGQRFMRSRSFIGADLELDGPHSFSFGYMLDRQMNIPWPKTRHILSLSYTYSLGTKKK